MNASAMQTNESIRKAAIVVAALGEELAAEVCSGLPVGQVLALGEELNRLHQVPAAELNMVLAEFLGHLRANTRLGGPAYAKTLLDNTLGTAQSVSLQDTDPEGLTILTRLNELEAPILWQALREETHQTVAAILSHLTATKAGQLLTHFDETDAATIAYRAAHLGSPSPGAMQALAGALDLELRAAHARVGNTPEVSLQFVVDLIGSFPPARAKRVIEALHVVDKEFGEGVAEQVFTFEDIPSLSDADLQLVLRGVEMSVLVLALKGTAQEVRDRIKQNLSQRGRERLEEEMEMLGPVPLSQVQDAQRQICHHARGLADDGQIGLDSGSTEYVE